MEFYRQQTHCIVTKYRHDRITFESCISHLDAALARFMGRMKPEQLNELRAVMLKNHDQVMEEMARRGRKAEC